MSHVRQCDRDTPFLLPPSVDEWLPEDHLARFVVGIVDQLDLSARSRQYRGTGSAAYHPSMLLALLLYALAELPEDFGAVTPRLAEPAGAVAHVKYRLKTRVGRAA